MGEPVQIQPKIYEKLTGFSLKLRYYYQMNHKIKPITYNIDEPVQTILKTCKKLTILIQN